MDVDLNVHNDKWHPQCDYAIIIETDIKEII